MYSSKSCSSCASAATSVCSADISFRISFTGASPEPLSEASQYRALGNGTGGDRGNARAGYARTHFHWMLFFDRFSISPMPSSTFVMS
jgi:hypothetical protein